MTVEPIILNPNAFGINPIMIDRRCQKDSYDNDVSLLIVPDRIYRIVHHTVPSHAVQRMTVFAGRGVKVKVRCYFPESDTASSNVKVTMKDDQSFMIHWGDGDNLGVDHVGNLPEEDWAHLNAIRNDDSDRFIAEVIALVERNDLWIRN